MKPILIIVSTVVLTLLLILDCGSGESNVKFVTDPSPSPSGQSEKIYISAQKGGQNISIYCSVTLNNVTTVSTDWRDVSTGKFVGFAVPTGVGIDPYNYLMVSDPVASNLTIRFTDDLDRLTLACLTTSEPDQTVTFFFGIPVITLSTSEEVYAIEEFSTFFLNLTDSNQTSFPPPITGIWRIDGSEINDPRVITTDYTITVENVTRNYSGKKFNLTVSNMAGIRSEEFILNVLYEPDFQKGELVIYELIGATVSITAATRIDGNPQPTVSWMNPNNTEIKFEGRFSQPEVGKLMITDLQLNDFGQYTFTVSNGIGKNIEINVTLIQIVHPGQPKNVSYYEETLDYFQVRLLWYPPDFNGVPPFSRYIITISPSREDGINKFNTTNTSFVLSGLTSWTFYNIFITATSDIFPNIGKPSQNISITTNRQDSNNFQIFNQMSKNGYLIIEWSVQRTGGASCDGVISKADCSPLRSGANVETLQGHCAKNFTTAELMGNLTLGPATAGIIYDCTVKVDIGNEFENPISFSTSDIGIRAVTGIPSSPIVTYNSSGITLRSEYPGFTSLNKFSFNVNITDENGIIVHNMKYTGSSELILSVTYDVGNYNISVSSQNEYGVSDKTTLTFSVTSTSRPNSTNQTALVAGAGGAGLVILVLGAILVLIGSYFTHRQTRYKSTIFTSNGELPEKKSFERARLPSVGSTVLY